MFHRTENAKGVGLVGLGDVFATALDEQHVAERKHRLAQLLDDVDAVMIDAEHLQAVALAKALPLQRAADERRAGQQGGFDERRVFGREIGIGKARVGDDLHAGGIFDLHDVLLGSLHQQDVAFHQRPCSRAGRCFASCSG